MKRLLWPALFLLVALSHYRSAAQHSNTYKNNPHYWANRKPDGAYWQQDVHYTINARIDEEDHRIDGTEKLVYVNNSPDTLRWIFYHLYQNAFIKGSYLDNLQHEKRIKNRLGRKEAAGRGIELDNIQVNGTAAKTELDNTILKVYLNEPLAPGQSAQLGMSFQTHYDRGSTRRRMQMWDAWGSTHYNGVQWYPKPCVYDRNGGWHTDQHLNKEFYGEFGTFDVTLDFPANYVLEATGALQNREEVLPKELREKLDMTNFRTKKWNEPPSVITPYVKGERKRWRYMAENVHDFAFTADPSYRIATTYWNGIECVGIAQEPHAAQWQNSADYVAKIIRLFSEDIGMYAYPKMVAADAQDGMEYPMLTLDGGADPGYRGLFIHEIGHNWFYGMVGSNETYRASMDEGFTQWLTAYGLKKLEGDTVRTGRYKNKWKQKYNEPQMVMDRNAIYPYTLDALNKDEMPLNTHSNDFHDALGHENGYRQVYYKTATMLYNLELVLGNSLFMESMRHYFSQWKMTHPYYDDFRKSIMDFTNQDLNWFFDQWLETTKAIDYSIAGVRKKDKDTFSVKLVRRGELQMPVDFTITENDGTRRSYHIPNTWFEKETQATILPRWYGWSRIQPRYEASVFAPSGIKRVQIDTTYRFADIYYPDNYWQKGLFTKGGVKTRFDGGRNVPADRRHYRLWWRPDVWYNPIDGIKAGLHAEGNYMNLMHNFDVTVWYNTHLLQYDKYLSFESEGYYDRYAPVNYSFNYSSPLFRRLPKLAATVNSRFLDGLWLHRAGLSYNAGNDVFRMNAQSFWRPTPNALDYLVFPAEWTSIGTRLNNSLNLSWTHAYSYQHGAGAYTLSARAPFITTLAGDSNPYDYAFAQLEAKNTQYLGKLEIRTRFFARYGTGNSLPYESLLFAAGANGEELMENKFTRTHGFIPENERGYNPYDVKNFHAGGGLNLRGFAGYFAPDERDGALYTSYKGRSGMSGNIELDVDNLFNLKPHITRNWLHLDAYVFADVGIIELSAYAPGNFADILPSRKWSDVRADAGVGFAFTVKQWGLFDKAKPLTVRVDFPLLINRAPYSNPQYFALRYLIGINRTF